MYVCVCVRVVYILGACVVLCARVVRAFVCHRKKDPFEVHITETSPLLQHRADMRVELHQEPKGSVWQNI